MDSHEREHTLHEIGRSLSALRIIDPAAEKRMRRSLTTYGQLSPVVCIATPEGVEAVDGFKRLRAAEALGWTTVRVICLATSLRACKAAMVQLNRVSRTISDLEEAMVLRSLHREDGLAQTELAVLLGRDKSWVCRRIALVERLIDEVWQHLGAGLLSVGVGRELGRLPRGNQAAALAAVVRHRLGKRETATLVSRLLQVQSWQHDALLRQPREALAEVAAVPATAATFYRLLADLAHRQDAALAGVTQGFTSENESGDALLRRVIATCTQLGAALASLVSTVRREEAACP
jgi:ParB/RepB/Spo0J family partition protein